MRQFLRKIRQSRAFRRYALPPAEFVKTMTLLALEAGGRYRHYNSLGSFPAGPPVPFEGDNPVSAESNVETRRQIDPEAIAVKTVENITYTRFGQTWVGGRLMREYGAKEPSFRDLIGPGRPKSELDRATIVQSFWATTYGDWVGEHLSSLIYFGCPKPPLALPGFLEDRPYVRRDCERLGLKVAFIDDTTLIRNCVILPKVRHGNYFRSDDPRRFCEAFGVAPVAPRAGSIVYLTRRRAVSYGPARHHPFEEILAAVAEIGARVIDTDDLTFDGWVALGAEAETVIADHGAALFNMMYWRPRCVIELFSGGWWNNSFLFVGAAVGVERHFLFNTDGLDRSAVECRVKSALAAFRSGQPLDPAGAGVAAAPDAADPLRAG